jgi:tetratricopeptide (TPR) repeat protein
LRAAGANGSTGWLRAGAAALAAGFGLALAGCASLPRMPGAPPAIEPAAPAQAPRVAAPEFFFLVGRQLELEGRYDDALEAFRRAAELDPESAYLQRKIAHLAARSGDLAGALEAGERAHALDPDDAETRLLLGTLHRLRRDAAAAEAVLRGPDGQPLDEDAAFLLYTIYSESERPADALAMARWMVERDPDSLRGWLAVAGAHERLEQPAEAERALQQALDHDPDNLAVLGALARSRRARGDREGEIGVHRQILERYPHHHATLVALADALVALNRTEEAIEALEDVERHHPEDVRSSVRLALLEYDVGRFESAAARLERALDASENEPEISYLLGLVRQRLDQDDAALAAFAGVPEDNRSYAEARTQMAVILEERGQLAEALAEVERARAVRASRPLDLYAASLRSKAGDADGAIAFLEGLLAQSPDDDELLYNLGVVHGEARRYEDALRYMQRALEKNPDNPAALNYVGYSWAEKGENLDQAEAMISRALELRPDDGYITDSLGWVYYMRARPLLQSARAADVEQGRALLQKALRELERASQLTGGDPVVAEHLGDVWLLKGDKRRALEFYEDAIEREPREHEQPELRRKFERLRQELGVQ